MITFDYHFHFLLWLWSALGLLDRALYKLSFIYLFIFYSQNLSRLSRIHWKKARKVGLKIGFGNQESIPLEGRILRIYPAFLEFTEKISFF